MSAWLGEVVIVPFWIVLALNAVIAFWVGYRRGWNACGRVYEAMLSEESQVSRSHLAQRGPER